MNIAEVKKNVRTWAQSEGPKLLGYQGAYLIGAINGQSDDSDWPPMSDVDVAFVVDEGEPTALEMHHRVFEYRGLLLDRSVQPSEHFQDGQTVLGSPWLAHHFAADSVLDDPSDWLTAIQQSVAPHYGLP